MSVVEERSSVLTQDEFEELARHAIRTNEALWLEFVDGKMGIKAVPDGDHGRIIEWLSRLCIQADTNWWLYPDQGLRAEMYRKGNARPGGSLAPSGTFVGQGEWASADGVLMVVEVTSGDADTDQRDRVEKPRAYAESGLPVYLLIDRDACEVKVHSQPDGVRYELVSTVPFGKSVVLPDPVGIELDTEPLKDWVH
ncbi:Uma2 family endonuclease [Streptomyces sp. H27-C3]|uniref:Uma2 family endonuclease n=1 Tax=Streptomyces sp. H27-C3 TaxID=3046305 RepID=UPI0024BB3172|nr:Uma2 family endonuclease [Streptomyces sp. H27-C3]MDJ0461945.1 Uma2 family endonuclease [Streptomyces sp. H27-C3]